MRSLVTFVAIIALAVAAVAAPISRQSLRSHENGLWSLDSSEKLDRWIEIHNLKDAIKTGVFHIDVIARKKGDPVWKIEHLKPHMAISLKALLASIRKPLKKGSVYPETFNYAYEAWLKGDTKPVCRTTVLECL